MKIVDMEEMEDGSLVVELNMTESEKQMFIQEGFTSILEKYMDNFETNPVGLELPPTGLEKFDPSVLKD